MPGWAEVNSALRTLLSDDEYASARASTLTAFYTPRPVIDAIFSSLGRCGFASVEGGANVLEPGCGVGNFMACAPAGYSFTGVEVDSLSARMAAALHDDAEIVAAGLEDCYVSPGSFDLVLGNVPYSDSITIEEPGGGSRLPIHDWFLLKAVESVRPGGVVAVLTSRYTLDKRSQATREPIAHEADLIGCVRLPEETFHAQAGTDVVSDLLVFRKKASRVDHLETLPEWVGTQVLDSGVPVNSYIAAHPECVVGEMSAEAGRFGLGLSVSSDLDAEAIGREAADVLSRQLALFGDIAAAMGERLERPVCTAKVPRDVDAFRYCLGDDGLVWYGDGNAVEPVQLKNPADQARLAAMVALRDKTLDLLALEARETDDEAVAMAISELDAAYDAFATVHGRLCDRACTRLWSPSDDPSVITLGDLEITDAHGRFVSKGEILSKRVRVPAPPLPERIEDAADALAVSIDRHGGVDIPFIAKLMDLSTEDAEDALGDLVLRDPESGSVVLAADYYTGDIASKLSKVRGLIDRAEDAGGRQARAAWLDECGISARLAGLRDDEGVSRIVAELKASGAWGSLTDPLSSSVSVVPQAHFERYLERNYSLNHTALALRIAQEMRAGAPAFSTVDDDGYRRISNPWHTICRNTTWSARNEPNDVAAAIVGMLDCQIAPSDLEPFVEALFDKGYGAAIGRITDIDVPSGDYRHLSYSLREAAAADRARSIRETVARIGEHPEIAEYLAACAERTPLEARRYGQAFDGADREGFDAFCAERASAIEAAMEAARGRSPEGGSPLRLDELKEIERRLSAALPARLTPDQISASLGSPWIPPSILLDFVRETFIGNAYKTSAELRKVSVSYNGESGAWQVKSGGIGSLPVSVSERFGTDERTCFAILESALNNSSLEVTRPDPNDSEGKRRIKDPEATARAWQRRHAVEDAFAEWVWADPSRSESLARIYNDRFNTIAPRAYDGSYLTLPGSNPGIALRRHQKDAVCRILRSDEGTLIAHSVGAGKTFTGVAAACEAKRLGKAAKPMFVVPNHLTGQWADEFSMLYPGSKVLYMTSDDTKSQESAQRFWSRVATGDWDAVIVGHSRFSQLKVSVDLREKYCEKRILEMERSIRESKKDGNDFSVKQMEANKKRLEARMERLRKEDRIPGFSFDDLGVDMLFVDEAHMFKNLAVATSMNVAGVSVAASAKCEDLLDKCTYLREEGHGSNIVFLTGTPVSNTMAELYNMQRYLAPSLLESQHVSSFSAWANTFGQVSESVEVRPEGTGFQVKQRFSKFCNLPELMAGFHTYADIMTADDLDLDVPECKVLPVAVQATDEQAECVLELADRAEAVRMGSVEPTEDNMLKITGDGRKIALDPKLVDSGREPLDGGKVAACAQNVYDVWRETEADSGTQLVFCDTSTPASGSWNIYDDMKRRLIELGIPASDIAFVSDAGDNPNRREALFERVRKGDVRVLLGSTQKLGTGTNVQTRLAAIHDLDCPWRPSDLEQRQGRVRRQGNMYNEVRDFRYVTVGTFDSYLYQVVERKQSFISQVFTNESPARDSPDFDESVLSYAEVKALATGDPNVARRMELENRIGQLVLLKQADASAKAGLSNKIESFYQPVVDALQTKYDTLSDDQGAFAAAAGAVAADAVSGRWSITVGGEAFTDKAEACKRILEISGSSMPGCADIGEYHGLRLKMTTEKSFDERGNVLYLSYIGLAGEHLHESENRRTIPRSASGTSTAVTQIDKIIERVAAGPGEVEAKLRAAQADLDAARASLAKPWERAAELDGLKRELADLPLAADNRSRNDVRDPASQGEAARLAAARPDDSAEPRTEEAAVARMSL